jgi:glycosyltransferase involved in cell wall biosynthesis
MARVWIVNPFDPLPGDPEQPGRYASLASMLRDAGHDVTWWSASFSHRFKRPIDRAGIEDACRRERIAVRLVETPGYTKNVSLRRIRSHRVFAAVFEREAARAEAPDVIIASNPPLEAAAAAGRVAARTGARLIVDVQDIWIDSFRRMLPGFVRWAWPVILGPWVRASRSAFGAADAVVGVAGGYADEPRRYGRADYRRVVVPLGIDLDLLDKASSSGRCLLGDKPPGEIWTIYSGSLSRNYDVITLARVAAQVARRRRDIRFIFSGRGELEGEVRRIVEGLPTVTFLGFAPFDDWAATVRQCDIGWNAVKPDPLVLLPNKVFYYWASGLALLSSIPGECADIIAQTGSGLTYQAEGVESACGALFEMLADGDCFARQQRASRESAERRWDRRHLYKPYVDLVAELAARR